MRKVAGVWVCECSHMGTHTHTHTHTHHSWLWVRYLFIALHCGSADVRVFVCLHLTFVPFFLFVTDTHFLFNVNITTHTHTHAHTHRHTHTHTLSLAVLRWWIRSQNSPKLVLLGHGPTPPSSHCLGSARRVLSSSEPSYLVCKWFNPHHLSIPLNRRIQDRQRAEPDCSAPKTQSSFIKFPYYVVSKGLKCTAALQNPKISSHFAAGIVKTQHSSPLNFKTALSREEIWDLEAP